MIPLDLRDPDATRRFLREHPADWIIHTAALTDVDACEERPDEARAVHVGATELLAQAAARDAMGFLLISTDSVFPGTESIHAEDAGTHPLNTYAKTKREGEERALASHPGALVVRTNFFGARPLADGRSLVEWALRELVAGRRIGGFTDVRFNPLWSGDLARLLLDLQERGTSGIVHLASREALTKYEFLRRLAQEFGFDPSSVTPADQAGRTWRARRPLCTVLGVARAERLLGRALPDVTAGLRSFHGWAVERGLPLAEHGESHGHR